MVKAWVVSNEIVEVAHLYTEHEYITHWDLNQMTEILYIVFWNAFSWFFLDFGSITHKSLYFGTGLQ